MNKVGYYKLDGWFKSIILLLFCKMGCFVLKKKNFFIEKGKMYKGY